MSGVHSPSKQRQSKRANTDPSLKKIAARPLLRRLEPLPFFSTYPISSLETPCEFALPASERLPHKTISSWNSLLVEFTRKHLFLDSLLSFKKLLLSPSKPERSTFPPLLKSCSSLMDADAGMGLHGFIMKYGFSSSNTVGNSVVSMYVKFGRARDALRVFEEIPFRDASSYNSLIWGFGINGFHEEALLVFEWMQDSGFSPSSGCVARVILACGELGRAEKGALVHDFVSRNGFGSDILVANSLISMYAKVGRLDRARWLFNDIPRRDLVSWNSMIVGYARSGNWVGAFDVFRSMEVENFVPNRVTFLGLILACVQAGDLDIGKSIHGHLICRGLLWDVCVGTSILDMYSKFGRVDCARVVFEEELHDRNLISWNSLIAGYSQNGHDYEAVELFLRMLHEPNVKLDSITIANVIPAYASLADLQRLRSVHGFIIKKGFELYGDVVLGTAIVDAYGKCLDIEAAFFLFNCIEKPNTATWNAMILGYNMNGQARRSMHLFLRMRGGEALPDSVTLVTILQSCSEMGSLEQGKLIHGYCLSSGFDSYLTVTNAMIGMYMICGCVKSMQVLFKSRTVRNIVTWNTVLSGSVKLGLFMIAVKLFRQMLLESQHNPDHVTMISVIQASVVSARLGEMLHGFVLKIGLDLNVLVANSLVDAYAKNGSIENARSLFEQMGHLRDQSSWNVMIAACGMNGQGEEACLLLTRMEEDGHKPNSITFISLLSSCSHSGMVDKGCEYFDLMVKKHGIQPGPEHYTCMIDMFGRAGRLEEAYRLIERMPNGSDCGVVWGALLSACRMSMNVELGELVGEWLSRLVPENCGYHSLLSNVYASAGRWDEAVKVRRVFEDGKLIKKPGLSVVNM
ncbi:pentatricopeptide repeat-containing protein At3g03580-like [Magnolia sinica]|uniref:pentatricopeptide repeat-containing protein At3g03580-like n=1 Tax=Magnolia sinica TaxID=86752 RepID=UPI002659A5E4|nr:pentatricopeptide repeat-containing protein At3g03580-like [Magnolia sinica]